jgi:uroporphyrinogen-III synthase
VTTVRVYQWDLPEDTAALRDAAHRVAAGDLHVALFTTSIQIEHLLRIAAESGIEEAVLAGLNRMMIGSIGPTTSEALEEAGVRPDMEPSHPKMGMLVQEAAARAEEILKRKS